MRDLSSSNLESNLDWSTEPDGSFETASLVDRYSAFDGNFRSQRDIRVEGELKGDVSCDGTLFIADGATVIASVDAEHVTVAGDLSGEIRCRGRLQILPNGRVRAKVTTASLVIQEGAVYEGQLEMAGIERSALRPLRARASATANPISIETASGDRQPGNGTTFIRRLGSPEAPWESPTEDAGVREGEDGSQPEGPVS